MDALLRSKEATEPSLKGLFTTAHLQFNAKNLYNFVKKYKWWKNLNCKLF